MYTCIYIDIKALKRFKCYMYFILTLIEYLWSIQKLQIIYWVNKIIENFEHSSFQVKQKYKLLLSNYIHILAAHIFFFYHLLFFSLHISHSY